MAQVFTESAPPAITETHVRLNGHTKARIDYLFVPCFSCHMAVSRPTRGDGGGGESLNTVDIVPVN